MPLAPRVLFEAASAAAGRLCRFDRRLYTGGMAVDKDRSSMTEPAYPVACYPVAPPPRGEDLPYSDGVPMESERHVLQMNLLADTLLLAWRDRHDFYVGRNMFVYFSELQSKRNDFRGPDVFVVLDTVRKERKSWVVWEEDGRTPDVVIEITSPSTESEDRGRKMGIYARILRVAEYYLFDPFETRLEGFVLDVQHDAYRPIQRDERGWLRSGKLGMHIGTVRCSHAGIEADWLRWIDEQGRVLPTGEERADTEASRAAAETSRADSAQERLRTAARKLLDSGMSAEQVAAALGIDVSDLKSGRS